MGPLPRINSTCSEDLCPGISVSLPSCARPCAGDHCSARVSLDISLCSAGLTLFSILRQPEEEPRRWRLSFHCSVIGTQVIGWLSDREHGALHLFRRNSPQQDCLQLQCCILLEDYFVLGLGFFYFKKMYYLSYRQIFLSSFKQQPADLEDQNRNL